MGFDKYKDRGLTGLANVGDTCYLNACLQILSHTYELRKLAKSHNKNDSSSLLLLEWSNLQKLMWKQNCVIAPNRFVSTVQKVASSKKHVEFASFQQNDIHEFWLFIMSNFHTSLARKVEMSVQGDVVTRTDKMAKACFEKLKETFEGDYSEIIDLFYGIEVTTIAYPKEAKYISITPDPFSTLTLYIPTMRRPTLYECFDFYCEQEKLIGDNAWYNEKTKMKENVFKGVVFWSLPTILLININRIQMDGRKNRTYIDCPLTDADFSKYVKGYHADGCIYDLYGVCNHNGGAGGGHYTANVKNQNGHWYEFNDTYVTKIDENRVITPDTYCLFYRKKIRV